MFMRPSFIVFSEASLKYSVGVMLVAPFHQEYQDDIAPKTGWMLEEERCWGSA